MDTNQTDTGQGGQNPPQQLQIPEGQALVEVLFDLGKLRVFHVVTSAEEMDEMPSRVYWADLRSQRQYGPFSSLQQAMLHYEWMSRGNISDPLPDERPDALVIHFDFNRKERIKFPMPGVEDGTVSKR